jgi:geranylgeranyl diphosphate synthase type II
MEPGRRIETALDRAVAYAEAPGAPPLLAEALRYAVFPGGHRIRPRLCLSVARACGDDDPAGSEAAAAAIELLHCASLVHDDLPCFDDAPMRRQKPAVHVAFGEPIAVLTGDALIVLAFETVARAAGRRPGRLVRLVGLLGRAAGSPSGIAAGQAW